MMENRKKTTKKNTTTKVSEGTDLPYFLPQDIWTNSILPALPVKTLLRFRSVCKLWCTTIDAPSFISTHLKLSNENREKKYILAIEGLGDRGLRGCRVTLRHSKTMWKSSFLFNTTENCYFQVACNGLVFVLLVQPVGLQNVTVKLWNPSIRKSLSVPPCPLAITDTFIGHKYRFGFRPSNNDYVLYAFRGDKFMMNMVQVSVAAYTLSDNLWRIRDYKLSLPSWVFGGLHKRESIFLEGTLHWFGRNLLVSFDLDEEKFSYLELPDNHAREMKIWAYRNLFEFDGLLAIFTISSEGSSVWVLRNKVWDRLFYGLSSSVGFNYFKKNPDVVTKSFNVENDGITLVYGKVAYKIMSDEIIPLTKSVSYRLLLDTYMESMVLHKGCPGQVLTSLNTPTKTTAVVTSV